MSALVQHKDITGADVHEPKGADTAASGDVFVADGAGSGSFQPPGAPAPGSVDHGDLTGLADDDHLQYLTEARHDALPADNPHSVTAAQVGADPVGTAAAAVTAHEAAADPHPDYLLETALETQLAAYLDRHHVNNSTATNNNTVTPIDYINQSFTIQNTGLYKVSVNYTWSHNVGATDFEATLLVGGVVVTEEHKQEPQDTAGAGPFGTDQRHKGQMVAFVNLTPGATTFQLQFAASTVNDNAAIYQADLYLERWT